MESTPSFSSLLHRLRGRHCLFFAKSAFAVLMVMPTPSHAQNCTSPCFQGFGNFANGVNADGSVVVGSYEYATAENEAARWVNGTQTSLGFLRGGVSSAASAVSSDGSIVVGASTTSPTSKNTAFSWTNGTMTSLGVLSGGDTSHAYGVSTDGSLVAGFSTYFGTSNFQAVRWSRGLIGGLGFLQGGNWSTASGISADGSVVVGYSNGSGFGQQAFRWLSSTGVMSPLGFLSGGNFSEANGVSPDGSVVVGYSSGSGFTQQAFRWVSSTGVMSPLGFLPSGGTQSSANGASTNGAVMVGQGNQIINGVSVAQAFRWTAATGMLPIKGLLTAAGVNTFGWELSEALAVSSDGTTMVGYGNVGGWLARLPVTATLYNIDTHDFDHSGRSDILWHDSSGNTAVWLMNGATISSSAFVGNVPTSWSIVGTRDFNGDGKADIVWRDTSGNTAIWFMKVGRSLQALLLGTCPRAGQSPEPQISTAMAIPTSSGVTPAAT